ncbi:restriction endonuclease subunit S [Bradyrhizobium japonicum]|uniref:restriction endonuclease subunit S n=1 Tax=Bradyrhizobium japonicum TaxID=375 RepID=UPI001BAD3A8D|nr:restriction endonuclease subunit S [Bradyrhizobium japonicum]MBR0913934.1 restriction endonuclease subunit S [Bradyrhizobium japonicum]
MSEPIETTIQGLIDDNIIERPIDGNHGSIHPKSTDYVASGIPFVMATDLAHGRIDFTNCSFITERQATTLRKGFAKVGDVLLSHKATIGRTAIVQDNPYPFIMLTPQVTYYRIKDKNRLSAKYLKYVFDSYAFQSTMKAWASDGSTRDYIGITAQQKLPIFLHSKVQQDRIVELIDPIVQKIELNRRVNETLGGMAQAIFRDWFVDFGPVRRKAAGEADAVAIMGSLTLDPSRAAVLAALFPAAFSDDGLPVGWRSEAYSDFVSIIGGGTPKTSEKSYWDGDIPWFSVADTPAGTDLFVFDTEKRITQAGLEGSSARLVPAGTTIISARGTVGNLAIAARDMAFNQSCYALRSLEGDRPFFTYLATAHLVQKLKAMAHGSVFSTITRQTFEGVAFPNGGSLVMDSFEVEVCPLFERVRAAVHESKALAEIRDYLLPRLMSGAVRAAPKTEAA